MVYALARLNVDSDEALVGNIVHFRTFNQHTIVLNGLTEANDLMHVRGGLYSGRKQNVMMNDL